MHDTEESQEPARKKPTPKMPLSQGPRVEDEAAAEPEPQRHFETRLSSIRRTTGKSQIEIADNLDISKATYSAWETGRVELRATRLVELAYFFRCSPNDILGFREDPNRIRYLDDTEEELVALFRHLPPNMKFDILDIMRSSAKDRRRRRRRRKK